MSVREMRLLVTEEQQAFMDAFDETFTQVASDVEGEEDEGE